MGIFRLDRIVKLCEPVVIVAVGSVEPVLVADLDILDFEWIGVAALSAFLAPFGRGVAGAILNFIKGFLPRRAANPVRRPVWWWVRT